MNKQNWQLDTVSCDEVFNNLQTKIKERDMRERSLNNIRLWIRKSKKKMSCRYKLHWKIKFYNWKKALFVASIYDVTDDMVLNWVEANIVDEYEIEIKKLKGTIRSLKNGK